VKYLGEKNKKNKMGGACGIYGKQEGSIWAIGGET
jgi:hypothetical protein